MSINDNPGEKSSESKPVQESGISSFLQALISGAEKGAKATDITKSDSSHSAVHTTGGDKSDNSKEKAPAHPEVNKILGDFSITSSAKADASAKPVSDTPPNVRTGDQPQIHPDHFAAPGKKLLDKIQKAYNRDDSQGVTKQELAMELQNPNLKGEDAQALVALYKNFEKIQDVVSYGWMSGDKITKADLDDYEVMEQKRTQDRVDAGQMKKWADGNLKKFSSGGSDFLTENAVDDALSRKDISQTDRDMLILVKKHFKDLSPIPYANAVQTDHFKRYEEGLWKDDVADLMAGMWSGCHAVATGAQKTGTSYDLYAGKDPLAAINPDAVRQGSIGDCYYEAVIASLANANPAAIRDAIKYNKDGTYTVKFGDGTDIKVTAPTEAELGLFNHGSQYGIWASVMEKAYGKYIQYNNLFKYADTPQGGADGGGRPEAAIRELTGSDSDITEIKNSTQSDVATKMESAIKNHKIITSTIYGQEEWLYKLGLPRVTADKFYRQHEYSITNFTPDGKGGGMVEVRNPWGGGNNSVDGTISIPLDKFMNNFSDVVVQK